VSTTTNAEGEDADGELVEGVAVALYIGRVQVHSETDGGTDRADIYIYIPTPRDELQRKRSSFGHGQL